MKRSDVIAAIEKRQDFNTTGGPNWTPGVAARAQNKLLIQLLVDLDLLSEDEARARFKQRHREHEERSLAKVERINAERRGEAA